MALISNLAVVITARNQQLKRALRNSTASVKRFSRKARKDLGRVKSKFSSVGTAVSGLNLKLIGLAGSFVVVGTAMRSVITTGRNFNASIADLSAITGATGKDLKFLEDASKEFGRTTTKSASEAAEAFKLIASAKPDLLSSVDALKQVTKEALTLAEASGSSLPEAANALGASLNQFGKGASEAARFVNVLAAGSKLGASEVRDTAKALKEAGVIASQAGISFEETNAAIQALAKDSIKAERAGTALKNFLLILSTQTDDSINPSIVGLSKALENLEKKNLSAAASVKLFGRETIASAKSLLKNRGDLDGLTKALTGTNIAQEQAAIKSKSFDGRVKALSSAIEGLQLELFDKLRPTLKSITISLIGLVNWVTKNITVIASLAAVIGVGGTLIVGIKAATLAFGLLTTALTSAAAAMVSFSASTSLLTRTTSVLISAFAGWQIGSMLRERFTVARVAGAAFVGALLEGWERVKFATKAAVLIMSNVFLLAIAKMRDAFSNFLQGVAAGLAKIPGFKSKAEELKVYAGSANTAAAAVQNLKGKLDALNASKEGAISAIRSNIQGLVNAEQNPRAATISSAKDAVSAAGNGKRSGGFGSITDVGTGRTLTSGKPQKIEVKVTADKEGIIQAVVNNEGFQDSVTQQVNTATKNAARATRR